MKSPLDVYCSGSPPAWESHTVLKSASGHYSLLDNVQPLTKPKKQLLTLSERLING